VRHTYKNAGVDIEAGDALVEKIKPLAAKTARPEMLSGVGGFGGLFALPKGKYREPILVSGTDGVGTKLKLAFAFNKHDTIGIDLVAMSVNDVLTCGAEPLFFLDYFATSKLDVDQATRVVAGIARGCEQAGCALLGGETAELPGFYSPKEYDVAGFAVGVVEKSNIIHGKTIAGGDAIIGLASSGLHSNGYSLARKIIEGRRLTPSLKRALLKPTQIYVKDVLALIDAVRVKGLAHITGSGIPGNLPRCLPKGTRAMLYEAQWTKPAIFDVLQQWGDVERSEMFSTFNMGLGMIAVVPRADVSKALKLLKRRRVQAWEVGHIEKAKRSNTEPEAIIEP
jgi:phosphoribosylformylglycinamidine cyclo-ligase